mgnify:CR=1 FL=1
MSDNSHTEAQANMADALQESHKNAVEILTRIVQCTLNMDPEKEPPEEIKTLCEMFVTSVVFEARSRAALDLSAILPSFSDIVDAEGESAQ